MLRLEQIQLKSLNIKSLMQCCVSDSLYSMTFMFSKVSVVGLGELCTYLGEAPADGFTLVRWNLRQKQSTADRSIVATILP